MRANRGGLSAAGPAIACGRGNCAPMINTMGATVQYTDHCSEDTTLMACSLIDIDLCMALVVLITHTATWSATRSGTVPSTGTGSCYGCGEIAALLPETWARVIELDWSRSGVGRV